MTSIDLKLQAGLNKESDLDYFISNGADEIYCGINSVPSHCYRLKTFELAEEIIKAKDKAHKNKIKFFFVANEVYSHNFYETVSVIEYLIRNKIDGVIIRDIGLLKYLKDKKIKTYFILSSLSLCFNTEALKFYSSLGIKRIAIPEHITPDEAKSLIQNPFSIDTEVFLTAMEYCAVLNGFCYLTQFNGKCICRSEFKTKDGTFFIPIPRTEEHYLNLYRFIKYGARIIKIGRHPNDFYGKIIFSQATALKEIFTKNSNITEREFVIKAMNIHQKISKVLERCQKIYKKR